MKSILLVCLLALCPVSLHAQNRSHKKHIFTTQGDHFTLDGKPFKVTSGELHYERIPRAYWHARLRMARAMGLNTVATYVFWNMHEPTPGHFDFTGNNDVAAFIRAAQQESLYVILRAGPYSRKSRNQIVVFDVAPTTGHPHVAGLAQPILNGPAADRSTSKQE